MMPSKLDAAAALESMDSMDALQAAVCLVMPQVGSVLVKGSRFMKMEQVVQALEAGANKGQNACEGGVC